MLVGLLLLLAIGTAACFKVEQRLDLSKPDSAVITARLIVDKTYAGAEVDLFLQSLNLAVPGLRKTASFHRYEKGEAMPNVVYEWTGTPQDIDDLPFTLEQQDDGTYSFSYPLGPFEGFSDQTESDTVLLSVEVVLPREIDMANTTRVDGRTAHWDLRRADLSKGIRLRAITK